MSCQTELKSTTEKLSSSVQATGIQPKFAYPTELPALSILEQQKSSPEFERLWNTLIKPEIPPALITDYAQEANSVEVNKRLMTILLIRSLRGHDAAKKELELMAHSPDYSLDLQKRAQIALFAMAYDQDNNLSIPENLLPPKPAAEVLKNKVWLLDVDGTLYAKNNPVADEIREGIYQYACEKTGIPRAEIPPFTKALYKKRGATISGLMIDHPELDGNPFEYMEKIHNCPMEASQKEKDAAQQVKCLPGRKLIFTNAYNGHANRVWQKVAGEDLPYEIASNGIDALPYSKPHPYSFLLAFHNTQLHPSQCVFVDDNIDNTVMSIKFGMPAALVDYQMTTEPDPFNATWIIPSVANLPELKIQ